MMLAMLGLTRPILSALTRIERRAARPIMVRATKGIVLANGGFVFNHEMLARLAPVYQHVAPLGTIGDDGSGIMMGASVGGSTDRLDLVSAWRFLYPPAVWTKGVFVARDGKRLVNEEAYGSRTGAALFEGGGGRGWLIIDAPLMKIAREQVAEPKLAAFQKYALRAALSKYATTADSIEELAAKAGIDKQLVETIASYNRDITEGRADALGKSEALRLPIVNGPFTAVDLSAFTKLNPIPGITVGGLRVDEKTGVVLDAQDQPVPNLYAAGRVAVGLPSNFYVSGLSLADCVWSGWRAARSLAGIA
jgi:3-oxo-5alpha-steroid 4-dehydrogenase